MDRTLFDTFANYGSQHQPPVILLLPGEGLKAGHTRVKLFFYNPGKAGGKSEDTNDIPIVEDSMPLSEDAGNYFTIRTRSYLPIINQFTLHILCGVFIPNDNLLLDHHVIPTAEACISDTNMSNAITESSDSGVVAQLPSTSNVETAALCIAHSDVESDPILKAYALDKFDWQHQTSSVSFVTDVQVLSHDCVAVKGAIVQQLKESGLIPIDTSIERIRVREKVIHLYLFLSYHILISVYISKSELSPFWKDFTR